MNSEWNRTSIWEDERYPSEGERGGWLHNTVNVHNATELWPSSQKRLNGKFYVVNVWLQLKRTQKTQGTWLAQSVKPPTLDFSSGRDVTVGEFEPHVGLCADRGEPIWDSFSLSLALPHALSKRKKH